MGKKGKTKLIHVGNRSKDEPARGILQATNKTTGNQHQKNSKKKIGYSSDDAQLYAAVEAGEYLDSALHSQKMELRGLPI